MKVTFLCFFLIVSPINIASQHFPQQAFLDSLNQKELEKSKTIAEIRKIEHEINAKNYSPWLQAGTLIAALIAAAISLITATRSQRIQSNTLNNQIKQHQKDKISDLLKELGSQELTVRIAAIQALSEYESTYNFLINMLKLENDQTIISVIAKALKKNIKLCIPLLIEETNLIHQEQLHIASDLVSLKIDRKEVSSKLGLDNKEFQEWISTKSTSRIESLSSFDFGIKTKPPIDLNSELKKLNERWETNITGYNNVILVIEELLGLASIDQEVVHIENAYLNGLTLNGLELKDWTFTNCIIDNSKFFNCNLENVIFSDIKAKKTLLRDCKVQNLKIINSSFKHGEFRDSKGKKIEFLNSLFFEMNFSGANIRKSNYTECIWTTSSLQGSMFNDSVFLNTKFYACDFSACFFQNSSYNQVQMTNSDFKTAKMINSKFQDSTISKLQVHKSSFDGSVFTNSKLNHIEFINSNFSQVKFKSSELYWIKVDVLTNLKYSTIDSESKLYNCSQLISDLKSTTIKD